MQKKICSTLLITVFFLVSSHSMGFGFGDLIPEDKMPEIIPDSIFGQGTDKEDEVVVPQDKTSSDNSSPIEQLAKEDIRKASLIGNWVGLVAGYVGAVKLCEKNQSLCDNDLVKQAIIQGMIQVGSGLGKQIGGAIGTKAADRRKLYASENDFLDSEIEASEKAISVREHELTENEEAIASKKSRIKALQERKMLTEQEIAESKALKSDIEEQISYNEELLAHYDEKLIYLNAVIDESEISPNSTKEELEFWEVKHKKLQDQRNELVELRNKVAHQNTQLTTDKEILENMSS